MSGLGGNLETFYWAFGETDVYGAQQHVPLAGHAIEWPETT